MIEHRYCCNNGECDGHPTVAEALDTYLEMRVRVTDLAQRNGGDPMTIRMLEAVDRRLAYIAATGHTSPSGETVRAWHEARR